MSSFNYSKPFCEGRYPIYQRSVRLKSKLDNEDEKKMALRSIGIKKELLPIFLDGFHIESEQFNIFFLDEFIKAYKNALNCQSVIQSIELMKHFGRATWDGFKEDFYNKPLGAWSNDGYIFIASCSKGRVVLGFSEGSKQEWFETESM